MDLRQPPTRPLVAASILSADFCRMMDEVRDVLSKGADLLHVDVMDGHFVPNLTMGPDMCRALRKHFPDVFLDVHLMVERPDIFVPMFADVGANNLTFHLEVCKPLRCDGLDAARLIDAIHARGLTAGMAINPPTPPEGLAPYLDQLDLVLVMSVNPGRSGQKFIPEVLAKTRWAKDRIAPHTRLEMDGGISPQTVQQATAAGTDMLVTASALFGATDRKQVIEQLHLASR